MSIAASTPPLATVPAIGHDGPNARKPTPAVLLLSAIKTALVEPPVNLLLPLGLGLLLLRGAGRHTARRHAGMWLAGLAFAGLLVLAIPAVGRAMLMALEDGLPTSPPTGAPPGAIVVLSGDDLRASPGGLLQPPDVGALTLQRMRAGIALHRRTGLPILVTGGVLREGEPPIAEAMARVMEREFATPVRWVEGASLNTWENATLSAAMLRAEGIGSVYVVTDAWHLRRALLAFHRAGLAATAAPSHYTGPDHLTPASFVPSMHGWTTSNFALHEWIGLAWYSLRY